MVENSDAMPAVLVQDETYKALPCLSECPPSVLVRRCGDTEDAIFHAMSKGLPLVAILERSSLTTSLLERLELAEPTSFRIVVRAEQLQPTQLEELIRLGCVGIVTSALQADGFKRMLSAVNAGEMWLPRKWSSYLIQQLLSRQRGPKLSKRELEVLLLLRRKLTNREMANALTISEETLRWHLRHLYAKTKRRSRGDLILYAEAVSVDKVAAAAADGFGFLPDRSIGQSATY